MQIIALSALDPDACCSAGELDQVLSNELFKALGEPHRLAILVDLAQKGQPSTVSELGACCACDLSVVSRHLSRMREAGVLTAEKRGKEVRYWVARGLSARLRAMADALDACCPPGQACAADEHAQGGVR